MSDMYILVKACFGSAYKKQFVNNTVLPLRNWVIITESINGVFYYRYIRDEASILPECHISTEAPFITDDPIAVTTFLLNPPTHHIKELEAEG